MTDWTTPEINAEAQRRAALAKEIVAWFRKDHGRGYNRLSLEERLEQIIGQYWIDERAPHIPSTQGPDPGLRLRAYYHEFDPTGVRSIDLILQAIAQAGTAYHSTEDWGSAVNDEDPACQTYWDAIQRAANEAAACYRRHESPAGPAHQAAAGFVEAVGRALNAFREEAEAGALIKHAISRALGELEEWVKQNRGGESG